MGMDVPGGVLTRGKLWIGPLVLSSILWCGSVDAAIVTRTFSFEATNFYSDSPPAVGSISGTFTISHDPNGASVFDQAVDFGEVNLNLGPQGVFGTADIGFDGFNSSPYSIWIGGINSDSDVSSLNSNNIDFRLIFNGGLDNPVFDRFVYTDGPGGNPVIISDTGTISIVRPVPLPSALVLLGTAILGFGALRSRRRS